MFGRLLDEGAGHWSIRPREAYEVSRRYEGDSFVLRTEFETGSGRVALIDALALEPGSRGHEIGKRTPRLLVRRVEGISGEVEMDLEFQPRYEYGLTTPSVTVEEGARVLSAGPTALRLSTEVPLRREGPDLSAAFTVAAGERVDFTLAHSPAHGEREFASLEADQVLRDTQTAWESWADAHRGYDGFATELVRRSALVIQALTYQPAGGVLAAATTSLPEAFGGEANWDYRFVWLRDLSLTMHALWIAACPDEADRFLKFIANASGQVGESVQILYGVEGERDLTERSLDHLDGFRGSGPVRVGNDAWKQKQLDVMGEVLDAAWRLRDQLGEFDESVRGLLVDLAEHAAEHWREPDAGMWEARDRERDYVTSKVMCWVALDRAVGLAARLGERADPERWRREADEIRATVIDEGWNEEAGAYTGAFGSDHLDASVLLMPLVGFLPADDPRMRATIDAIARGLGDRGLVRRWDTDTGGFLITTYWLAGCLALAADVDRAEEWFNSATRYANDLGLLSEMVDLDTDELLGNFPQTFSHIGLINAAWEITQARSRAGAASDAVPQGTTTSTQSEGTSR